MATHCSILAWEIPWTEEAGQEQCYNGVEHPAGVWRIDLVVAVGKSHTFDVRSTRNKNDSERVFENKGLAEVQSVWERSLARLGLGGDTTGQLGWTRPLWAVNFYWCVSPPYIILAPLSESSPDPHIISTLLYFVFFLLIHCLLLKCNEHSVPGVSKWPHRPHLTHYLFLYGPPPKNRFYFFEWLENIERRRIFNGM